MSVDAASLGAESWKQIGLFGLETVVVAVLLAALFRGRRRFGLSPLFATLGVFQYLQVLLAFSIYVEVMPGVTISPGSVVFFSGSLFGLLLVFLRESPAETKTLVYGLFAANLSLSLFSLLLSFHLESPLLRNPYSVPEELFRLDARILVIGTLVLVLDMLLMIGLYPILHRLVRAPFLRVSATLCTVLAFDSVVFMSGAFWGQPFYLSALGSSVAAKLLVGLIYSLMLVAYLRWVEPRASPESLATPGQVITWAVDDDATEGPKRVTRDPELGVLPRAQFIGVADQLLTLGEQLGSEVTVLVFRLQTHVEAERVDLLRYLLAVLRSNLSRKAVFGRQGEDALAVVIPSTGPIEAERICGEIDRALAEALTKVRPTLSTIAFTVSSGFACSPGDGWETPRLLALAESGTAETTAVRLG